MESIMTRFKSGEHVAIPANIARGAFPGEYLVTIDTISGSISGFVRDRDMVEPQKTIQGSVHESTPSVLSVMLSGSYFTTNGFAEFAADWAEANIKAIA